MFAFHIEETEIRSFMNKLLREQAFDHFEVRGVEVSSFTKFEITGIIDKDFITESDRKYCTWAELRPYIFNIIKGNKRPKSIKIIFSLPPEEVELLHNKASAYFLNIALDGSVILCTTASSEKSFSMDKSHDVVWDEYIQRFMKQNQILISTLP